MMNKDKIATSGINRETKSRKTAKISICSSPTSSTLVTDCCGSLGLSPPDRPVTTSSSYKLDNKLILCMSGKVFPFSQFEIVCLDTFILFARSSCVNPCCYLKTLSFSCIANLRFIILSIKANFSINHYFLGLCKRNAKDF